MPGWSSDMVKKVNLLSLFIGIILIWTLPTTKEIWYDECISIICSQGLHTDVSDALSTTKTISSAQLAKYNNVAGVYRATVLDNGNSFPYNLGQHYFTSLAGHTIQAYTAFSQLCGTAALIAFFVLAGLIFGGNVFVALATLLMATDTTFLSMHHEIRGYVMGIFFVTTAAIYFWKYVYEEERAGWLFLCGLFSAAAILSHFLAIYIILVFAAAMVWEKRGRLLAPRNLIALGIPVLLLVIYFYSAYAGLVAMGGRNQAIQQQAQGTDFRVSEVLLRSMTISALDFKAVFPAFRGNTLIIVLSWLLLPALLLLGLRMANYREQRRNLIILFSMGLVCSLFLAALAIKAHHYTSLYHRYHSFCLPFTTLFTTYVFCVVCASGRAKPVFKYSLILFFAVPAISYYAYIVSHHKAKAVYSHAAVAREVVAKKLTRLGVANWYDALLVNSLLPGNYKIDYDLNERSGYFTFPNESGSGTEVVPVVIGD